MRFPEKALLDNTRVFAVSIAELLPGDRVMNFFRGALIFVVVLLPVGLVRVAAQNATGAAASAAPGGSNGAPAQRPASTMSELMIRVIYPTSDAVFYISTRVPSSDAEWGELQTKTLMLAESANLLMMPGRARDTDRWMTDARLMFDVGQAAFRAAKAKDVDALDALNDQLYQSCVQCHEHYRPGYGRRRP